MKRRDFLGAGAAIIPAAAAAAAASASESTTLRDRVLGAWRILDAETVNVTSGESGPWLGRARPYTGMIVYLPSGFMSVQIGAARPAARRGAGFDALSFDDKITYVDTWYAYYGRFEIDERQSQVRHYVEGSLFAFETGATLVRTVSLQDDVLTLKTLNLQAGPDGETFNRLTWARL